MKTATYGYDNLSLLVSFSLPVDSHSQSFAYDLNGNLTSKTTNASTLTFNYSYSTTPNRLDSTTGTGGVTNRFNAGGWITAYGGNTLAYDHRGSNTAFNSAAYTNDSEGNRVKKVSGSQTIYYLRGIDGSLLAEYDGTGIGRAHV